MATAPQIDRNIEKWTAFCKNEEDAEELLQSKRLLISQKKLIVSAKKEIVESKSNPRGLFIYKFTIVTSAK
jgi:hypothetical protein